MGGCAAINCCNSSKSCRLFVFPSDPIRRATWVHNMQRDKFTPTKGTRLCEYHFENSQFELARQDGWKKLKPNAVPTVFDIPNRPPKINPSPIKSVYKDHFDENQWENKRSDGWRKLKPFAVPTIFETPDPPKRLASVRKTRIKQPSECLQIEIAVPENDNSILENKEPKKSMKSRKLLDKSEGSVDKSNNERTCEGTSKDDSPPSNSGCAYVSSSSFTSQLRKRRLIDYAKNIEDSEDEDDVDVDIDDDDADEVPSNTEKKNLLLCRVCCMKDLPLIFIHKESKLNNMVDVTVVEMLIKYLPIEIRADEEFPLYICSSCIDTLNKWHELYITCAAADKAFKNTHRRGRKLEITEMAVTDKSGRRELCNVRIDNLRSAAEEGQLSSSSSVLPITDKQTTLKENKEFPFRKGHSMCTRCKNVVKENEEFCEKVHSEFLRNLKSGFRKVCKYCSEPFVDYDELKTHCVSCKETSTVCEMCGKLIPTRRELLKHKTIFHSPLVICDKCGKSMAQRHLYRHMQAAHFPLQSSCLGCCKIFRTKFHYNEHMRKHVKGVIKAKFTINPVFQNEKRYFVCPVCKQSFNVKLSLVKHLVKTKLIKCNTCHKKLTCEKNVLTHSCQKYSCKYCSKCFYRKNRWEKHEQGHTGKNSSNGQFLTLHQNSSSNRNTTQESCVFFS